MGVRPKFVFPSWNRRGLTSDPKPPENSTRSQNFTKIFTTFLTEFTKFLACLWIIVLTLFLLFNVKTLWKLSIITIKPFEVSKQLGDAGFTGQIISDLLMDDMKAIHDSANSRVHSGSLGQPMPDHSPLLGEVLLQQAKLPGTGVSMEAFSQTILDALGHSPINISGNLLRTDQSTILTLRIAGNQTKIIESPPGRPCLTDCIKTLLQEAARQTYLTLDSYALATYYYDRDPARCEATIRYCLLNDNSTDDAPAYNLWGLLLKSRGERHEAESKFLRALKRLKGGAPNPRLTAVIYSNWGILLANQGKFDLAREKYARAWKADDTYIDSLYNWGLAWQKENKLDEAEVKYREAIRRKPDLLFAHYNLAHLLTQRGRTDDALKVFAEMERVTKYRNPEVYIQWAIPLIQRKRYAEAIEKYDRALELNPENIEVRNYKASLHQALGAPNATHQGQAE